MYRALKFSVIARHCCVFTGAMGVVSARPDTCQTRMVSVKKVEPQARDTSVLRGVLPHLAVGKTVAMDVETSRAANL